MDTPTLVPFKIIGGTIDVDGHDLTDQVRGYELVGGFGDVPRLVLHLQAGGSVEGLAHVTVASTGDPASAVRALDPGEVRDRCAADPMADMSTDPVLQAIDVIAQMLDEAQR